MFFRDTDGHSFIELLVALGIASIVAAGVYTYYETAYKTSIGQERLAGTQQDGRIAMERMSQDIRQAGCSIQGTTPILQAGATTFEFEADLDPDPNVISSKIKYLYNAANRTLERSIANWNAAYSGDRADAPVIEDVINLQFTYFDGSGALITIPPDDINDIRRIDIALTVETPDKNPATNKKDTATLDTSVYLRCMGIVQRTDTTPPNPPDTIIVSDPGICGRLDVSWSYNGGNSPDADTAGHKIYYRPTVFSSWSGVITVPGRLTTAKTVTGLEEGTNYTIAVTAYDVNGNEYDPDNPEEQTVQVVSVSGTEFPVDTTPDDNTGPAAPTITNAAAGDRFVTVTFDRSNDRKSDLSDAGVESDVYYIQRWDNDNNIWNDIGYVVSAGQSSYSYTDTTVLNCPINPYSYQVRAEDCAPNASLNSNTAYGDGSGNITDQPVDGVTNTSPADTVPPADPSNFNAVPGVNQIYLSYTSPGTNKDATLITDLAGVKVLRKLDGNPANSNDGTLLKDETPINPINAYSLIDDGSDLTDGIKDGTTYYYTAFAYDVCMNYSDGSSQSQATAQPCGDGQYPGPPSAPTNLSSNVCGGVTLTWTTPTTYMNTDTNLLTSFDSSNDITGYYIYRKDTTGTFSITDRLTNPDGTDLLVTSTSFSDANVSPGTTYYYWVTTVDCANNESTNNTYSSYAGPLSAMPSGIAQDTAINVITLGTPSISGSQHNIVEVGIQNQSTTSVTLDTLTPTWLINTAARLKKVTLKRVGDTSYNLLWEDTSTVDLLNVSGTVITFTAADDDKRLAAGATGAKMRLEFRTPSNSAFMDMRSDTIDVTFDYTNDAAGNTCTSSSFSFSVPVGPDINAGNTTQNRPDSPSLAKTIPGFYTVEVGTQDANYVWTIYDVGVQTEVTPETGTSLTTGWPKLFYALTDRTTSTPPSTDYSSSPDPLVWTSIDLDSGSGNFYSTSSNIPVSGDSIGKRVWYYIHTEDDKGNFDISPEPSLAAMYTYDQNSKFNITLTVTRSGPGNEDVVVGVAITDEDSNPVSGAAITVDIDKKGGGGTYENGENGTMTEVTPAGTYSYTASSTYHDKNIRVVVDVTKAQFTDATCGITDIDKNQTLTTKDCN